MPHVSLEEGWISLEAGRGLDSGDEFLTKGPPGAVGNHRAQRQDERILDDGTGATTLRGIGSIHHQRNLDLNDYKPVQAFSLSHLPVNIHTINHDLAKNIIAVTFEMSIQIYKLSKNKTDGEEFFSLISVQEFILPNSDSDGKVFCISSTSINPSSNVGEFGERRLVYAICLQEDSKFYFVSEVKEGKEPFNRVKTLGSDDVQVLDCHAGALRHLSFDAERGELLALLSDDALCLVWEMGTLTEVSRFTLASPGVTCLWHKSEPYKLLVVEECGLIRVYNTLKQSTIFTINTLLQPVYAADWCPAKAELVGIGANKCACTYDLSLLNSEAGGKRVEAHLGATHSIKFSTTHAQQFATATMGPRAEVKTFQQNIKNSIWTSKQESLQNIAWLYGEPFLLALAGKQLLVYQANLV